MVCQPVCTKFLFKANIFFKRKRKPSCIAVRLPYFSHFPLYNTSNHSFAATKPPSHSSTQAPSRHMRLTAYGCCIPTLTRFTGPIAQDPDINTTRRAAFLPQNDKSLEMLVYAIILSIVKFYTCSFSSFL